MIRSSLKVPALLLGLAIAANAGCSGSGSSRQEENARYQACLGAETQAVLQAQQATTGNAPPKGPFNVALLKTEQASLLGGVRDGLKASMKVAVNASRASPIAALRCAYLRPEDDDRARAMRESSDSAGSPSGAFAGSDPTTGGAKDVSTTNNQVAGVDEADFLKNDSKYIYVVSGSTFRVIEAWPAPTAREIAQVEVPGAAKKLFVEGNRALVYSSITPTSTKTPEAGYGAYADSYSYGGGSECTYGQNGCVPSSDGTETEISIFDISNRAAPLLLRSIHSSSSLLAARRIGNAVHSVLSQESRVNSGWQVAPSNLRSKATEAEVNVAYDALITEQSVKLDQADLTTMFPTWRDSRNRPRSELLYQSQVPGATSITSVLSLDLVDDARIGVASVLSQPGWVYASAESLYMAVPHEQRSGWGWFEGYSEPELSTIHRFAIGTDPLATSYGGTGVVKGRVLNQFALDEDKGFLRVATTTGHLPSPDTHNTLAILQRKDAGLVPAGIIDRIAPTEDIRSVRFDGDRGYMVTFKKTDPLYVFDLKDAFAPKILGELKIPGFSTYMHMMDANHLLTIGYDAADQGDFAYFTSVILQIFDVTNPADPKLTHKESIGTRGSSSEALTNHLAFNYFAPKNLLALPMTICEGGDDSGGYGTQMTFSGLMVYDTTVATGFQLRGKVPHPSAGADYSANSYGYYDAACSNWWTNATSEVKRSIIMDDFVFSVSDARIKVSDLTNLGVTVKELSLVNAE